MNSKTFIVGPGPRARREGHWFNSLWFTLCTHQKNPTDWTKGYSNYFLLTFCFCMFVCTVKTYPVLWKQQWNVRIATISCLASMTLSSAWWKKETPSCFRKVRILSTCFLSYSYVTLGIMTHNQIVSASNFVILCKILHQTQLQKLQCDWIWTPHHFGHHLWFQKFCLNFTSPGSNSVALSWKCRKQLQIGAECVRSVDHGHTEAHWPIMFCCLLRATGWNS